MLQVVYHGYQIGVWMVVKHFCQKICNLPRLDSNNGKKLGTFWIGTNPNENNADFGYKKKLFLSSSSQLKNALYVPHCCTVWYEIPKSDVLFFSFYYHVDLIKPNERLLLLQVYLVKYKLLIWRGLGKKRLICRFLTIAKQNWISTSK